MDEASKVGGQARMTLIGLACLALALVLVAAVVVWAELRTPAVYDPLHYTNPQTVTSRVNALSGAPAAQLRDTVNVTGEKCADEDVDVITVVSWKPIEPRASAIQIGEPRGSARESGCVTSRFQNEIPPEVRAAVRRQHDRGYPAPLWRIEGAETPIGPEGEGTPEVWFTEPFAIIE